MSYCRWSSDNWQCDLYIYADVGGGYTTHVAANRVVGEIPFVPDLRTTPPEVWAPANKAQLDWLATCERQPIGLSYDGMSFNDPSLVDLLDRLEMLGSAGYHFPSYLVPMIRSEIADGEI